MPSLRRPEQADQVFQLYISGGIQAKQLQTRLDLFSRGTGLGQEGGTPSKVGVSRLGTDLGLLGDGKVTLCLDRRQL